MKKYDKKTKIVCTIGPASWKPEVMKKLADAGMNVARINGAYADVAELKRVADVVRNADKDVALMLDIKGNDVRLNKFEEPINIKVGQELVIGSTKEDHIHPANYLNLYKDLKKDALIVCDDGKVRMVVTKIEDKKIYCKVTQGSVLKPGKSLNTPGVLLSLGAVTEFDIDLIKFAIEDKWDFIAASYIRNVADAKEVKKYTKGSNIQVIAKIEEEMGVSNYDDILKIVDGIMIGRGDMGVEMPFEKIPAIQKMMIEKANLYAKPIITATNVMESMIDLPFPTRAEISDAANAIFDGTDAIMTSGETSAGNFPVETVEAISKIAVENEQYLVPSIIDAEHLETHTIAVAMTNAAFEVYEALNITHVLMFTGGGTTAKILARYNIDVPIYAYTDDANTQRQLAMSKGITPIYYPKKYVTRNGAINGIIDHALKNKLINKLSKVLIFGKASNISARMKNIFEYIDLSSYKY